MSDLILKTIKEENHNEYQELPTKDMESSCSLLYSQGSHPEKPKKSWQTKCHDDKTLVPRIPTSGGVAFINGKRIELAGTFVVDIALSIMSLYHAQGGKLPEKLVGLFNECYGLIQRGKQGEAKVKWMEDVNPDGLICQEKRKRRRSVYALQGTYASNFIQSLVTHDYVPSTTSICSSNSCPIPTKKTACTLVISVTGARGSLQADLDFWLTAHTFVRCDETFCKQPTNPARFETVSDLKRTTYRCVGFRNVNPPIFESNSAMVVLSSLNWILPSSSLLVPTITINHVVYDFVGATAYDPVSDDHYGLVSWQKKIYMIDPFVRSNGLQEVNIGELFDNMQLIIDYVVFGLFTGNFEPDKNSSATTLLPIRTLHSDLNPLFEARGSAETVVAITPAVPTIGSSLNGMDVLLATTWVVDSLNPDDYLHFVVKSESNVSLVKQEVLPLQTVQDSEHDNTPLKRFRADSSNVSHVLSPMKRSRTPDDDEPLSHLAASWSSQKSTEIANYQDYVQSSSRTMSTRFEPDRLNGHDGSFTVSPPKRFQSSSVNSDTDDDPGDSDPDYRPVPILKNQSPRRSSRIKGRAIISKSTESVKRENHSPRGSPYNHWAHLKVPSRKDSLQGTGLRWITTGGQNRRAKIRENAKPQYAMPEAETRAVAISQLQRLRIDKVTNRKCSGKKFNCNSCHAQQLPHLVFARHMCIPRGGMFRCRVLSDCNQAYRSFHWANWHMAMFHQSVFELAHLYQPPGGVRFMCMFCQPSRPCKDRTEFVYHCRTKHRLLEEVGTNNVTYICDICSQVFYTTKDLKSHLRDRYIRERIHCTYCGYVSRSGKPYALQRHYSTKHIGKAASTEK